MGVSVEPGTVAQNLTGEDDALGLIDLTNVQFKYVIKGCKSGFKKDATDSWKTKDEKIKLYKNDTGCVAELAGIKMNGSEFNKIVKKDNKTDVAVSVNATKAAAGTSAKAEVSYYFYKSSTATQFVLKVPDHETFSTASASSIKWTFESIRSDLALKNVQGVSNAQGMSVGALEAPNLTLAESDLTFTEVIAQKTVGSKTYYGFTTLAKFTCEDPATSNAKKINGTGADAACKTNGGDNQKLSNMKAVMVPGRVDDSTALTYDEAVAKFDEANAVSAAVGGAASGSQAAFTNIPWYQDSALASSGSMKGWLIVRMEDSDGTNKFYSYTVFNIVVSTGN